MSRSQALWSLAPGESLSLEIGPGPRELAVANGRVWLTRQGSVKAPAEDVWLEAGQSLALPAGARVVLEAWPQAEFQLLVPPTACRAARSRPASRPVKWVFTKALGVA